jgi:hypothetical protein
MPRISDFFRAAILGFVGFCSPRFAVAMGVPLDQWIADAASWLMATKDVITRDQAIWGAMLVTGVVLAFAELWWHPLRRLLGRSPREYSDAELFRAQAELEKQRRLTLKEQRSVTGKRTLRLETTTTMPKPTGEADFFAESSTPIHGAKWSCLLRVADDARRMTEETELGFAALDYGIGSRADVLAFYAGMVSRHADLFGILPPTPTSERIPLRWPDQIAFHINGGQIDSTSARDGKDLYRFIHLRTSDVPATLAKIRERANDNIGQAGDVVPTTKVTAVSTISGGPDKPKESKTETVQPVKSENLVGKARFFYDSLAGTMILINKQDIETVTIDKNDSYTIEYPAIKFITRFVFFGQCGPFNVQVISSDVTPEPLIHSIIDNDKSFVKISFSSLYVSIAGRSATEITVSFYRR